MRHQKYLADENREMPATSGRGGRGAYRSCICSKRPSLIKWLGRAGAGGQQDMNRRGPRQWQAYPPPVPQRVYDGAHRVQQHHRGSEGKSESTNPPWVVGTLRSASKSLVVNAGGTHAYGGYRPDPSPRARETRSYMDIDAPEEEMLMSVADFNDISY
jgi:hypothetical protein